LKYEIADPKRAFATGNFLVIEDVNHERAERHGYDKLLNLASHGFIGVPRKHTPLIKAGQTVRSYKTQLHDYFTA
jgi:hypothetical protein